MVLLRFAPSPTGPLHLGGLRMALYNYLFAKKHGGKWILRVEDTDTERTVPGSVDGIRKALDWAGLEYDYGPHKEGPHGPYFQSERLDNYLATARKLLDEGHAYKCFCSADKLASTRERLARSGSNLSYDKACLHLTDEEVARKVKSGEKFIVRLNDSHRPTREPTTDLVFGALKDAHGSIGTDPVLLKSDSFPTYHLASVVDDLDMGITHVLRGQEWITSLPLHLDLYAHLGKKPPQFAHIPILVNPDGSKMSKRKGDVQVIDYMRRGWEPSAVLNWLALAGWGADHEPDTPGIGDAPASTTVMDMPELISNFELSALTQRSCGLDPEKLEFFNKQHISRMVSSPQELAALTARIHDQVKDAFPASQYTDLESLQHVIKTLDTRLRNIQDIPSMAPYFFLEPDFSSDEARAMLRGISPADHARILSAVTDLLQAHASSWDDMDLLAVLTEERDRIQAPKKAYMTTLRHALAGRKDGPGVVDIMRVLGFQRVLGRLQSVQELHK
ncbi:hypothetical protein C8J56DRAFT_850018 [Mycena floridula]|nr:hypothetical protein C8J56DRAFT_850018 [Mycena floridula]